MVITNGFMESNNNLFVICAKKIEIYSQKKKKKTIAGKCKYASDFDAFINFPI